MEFDFYFVYFATDKYIGGVVGKPLAWDAFPAKYFNQVQPMFKMHLVLSWKIS